MTRSSPPDTRAEPVIRVSYQSSLGSDRGAVFETYVPQSVQASEISDILDKLRSVCERQTAIVKIEEIKRALVSDRAQLAAMQADMQRVEEAQINAWDSSGRKGSFKLTQAEAQHRQNFEGSIVNRKKSIELLEAQLAEYMAQIYTDVG